MHKPNAQDIAWWAETAHGLAGEKLVLAENSTGLRIAKRNDLTNADKVVCEVDATPRVPDRPKPEMIAFRAPGHSTIELKNECDALFWTESAIEKFFIPYYEAQRLLSDDDMNKLKATYREKDVVAMGHIPPSHELVFRAADSIRALVVEPGGRKTAQGETAQGVWKTLSDFPSSGK